MSSTPVYSLYLNWVSQPSRAVWQLFVENSIEVTPIHKNLFTKETRSEEFLKINPFGHVPVLKEENPNEKENPFILYER